jgi:hypothetical protein
VKKQKVLNSTILITTGIFLFIVFLMTTAVNKLMGNQTAMKKYFIKSDYLNAGDLFQTLFNNPERLFVWCCDCIRFYAIQMGISYEQLNIDLFVILLLFLPLLLKIKGLVGRGEGFVRAMAAEA